MIARALRSVRFPLRAALGCALGSLAAAQDCTSAVAVESIDVGTPGASGVPELRSVGAPLPGTPYGLELRHGPAGAAGLLLLGPRPISAFIAPWQGALVSSGALGLVPFVLDAEGNRLPIVETTLSPAACGTGLVAQALLADGASAGGVGLSNGLSVHIGEASGPLFPVPRYSTPGYLTELVTEDMDGDGLLDIVLVGGWWSFVALRRGTGDGSFGAETLIDTSDRPSAGLVADLDGSGQLDLALTLADSNAIEVFLQPAVTPLAAGSIYLAGSTPNSIAAADFDLDGFLDLAVGNLATRRVSVLWNDATGGFPERVAIPVDWDPDDVATGDFDENGAPDIAVAVHSVSSSLRIVLSNGDRTFASPIAEDAGVYADDVDVADFDGDGHEDVLLANSNSASVVLGRGDGTFEPEVVLGLGAGNPGRAAPADVNGDDHLDIALTYPLTQGVGDVVYYLGVGNGTFEPPVEVFTGGGARLLAAGDFDQNGADDLAIAETDSVSTLSIVLAEPDGFASQEFLPTPPDPDALFVGDLDGDGFTDLAVSFIDLPNVGIEIRYGVGGAEFTPGPTLAVLHGIGHITTADLDSDGRLDLIANHQTSGPGPDDLSVFLANGDRSFGPLQLIGGSYSTAGPVIAEDVDGDGIVDLASLDQKILSNVLLFLGNGDGSFQEPITVPTGQFAFDLEAADLDADGAVDLVVSAGGLAVDTDGVLIHLGNGDGTFALPQLLQLASPPLGTEILDFSEDGVLDLVVALNMDGSDTIGLVFLIGDGAGDFVESKAAALGTELRVFGARDLNGDGRLDFFGSDFTSTLVALDDGQGGYVEQSFGSTSSQPRVVLDVNEDGMPDFVQIDPALGAIALTLNQVLQ